jgi:hypothetical protein
VNQSVSSLRVESLMTTLNNLPTELRKLLIIDACFAGEAAAFTQSDIQSALGQQMIPIPDRFESNPTLANGDWVVATMPSRIQSDLEAV